MLNQFDNTQGSPLYNGRLAKSWPICAIKRMRDPYSKNISCLSTASDNHNGT